MAKRRLVRSSGKTGVTAAEIGASKFPTLLIWRLGVAAAVIIFSQYLAVRAFSQYRAELSYFRADKFVKKSQMSQARIAASDAVGYNPYHGQALFVLGAAEFAAADTAQKQISASATLEHAATYNPFLPNILKALAQSFYSQGKFQQAADIFGYYFRVVPNPKTGAPELLWRLYALALFNCGHYGSAAIAFSDAMEFEENRLQVFVPRLINELAMYQTASAEAMLRSLSSAAPGRGLSEQQVDEMFAVAMQQRKLAALADVLDASIKAQGRDRMLVTKLAAALTRLDRTDEALSLITQLRSDFPKDPDLPLIAGKIEFRRQHIEAARQNYREHLKLKPNSGMRRELESEVGPLE